MFSNDPFYKVYVDETLGKKVGRIEIISLPELAFVHHQQGEHVDGATKNCDYLS